MVLMWPIGHWGARDSQNLASARLGRRVSTPGSPLPALPSHIVLSFGCNNDCTKTLDLRGFLEGVPMATITLKVNRQAHTLECASTILLVEALREHLRLTGTHVGCDTSQCGACTVHVNGKSVKSCTMLAAEADGAEITTIEGLAQGGELHPMQAAFREH